MGKVASRRNNVFNLKNQKNALFRRVFVVYICLLFLRSIHRLPDQ